MRCGHRHCIPCWQAYLTSEIEGGSLTGGSALDTRCAGFKCQEALGHECVELILAHNDGSAEQEATHARLLQRYEGMLARSFVDENDSLQWCPSPGCDRVLESHAKLNTVKCSCGCVFCFRCCLDAHAPCSCAEAADWNARDKGNSNLDTKFMVSRAAQHRCCLSLLP
jgi:ariadne-1